jgi:hypothetical protein
MKNIGTILPWTGITVVLGFFILRWILKPEFLKEGGSVVARLERDEQRNTYKLHLAGTGRSDELKIWQLAIRRSTWAPTRPSPPNGFVQKEMEPDPAEEGDDFNAKFAKELNDESIFWYGNLLLSPGKKATLEIKCDQLGPLDMEIAYEERRANVTVYKNVKVTA